MKANRNQFLPGINIDIVDDTIFKFGKDRRYGDQCCWTRDKAEAICREKGRLYQNANLTKGADKWSEIKFAIIENDGSYMIEDRSIRAA